MREYPAISKLLKKIAPKIGARVYLEPLYGFAGMIVFKSGRKSYFRASSLDINALGASDVAIDKDFATCFMTKLGYPTVVGQTFFSDQWAAAIDSEKKIKAAYQYAKKIGFPVIVKPNSKSQGQGVDKVYNKKELYKLLKYIFTKDRVALVQPFIEGKDYRIVVFDDQVIAAYQRIPLNVVGDGFLTIKELLLKKFDSLRGKKQHFLPSIADFRIKSHLQRQGLNFGSILKQDKRVFLLSNANLSNGGDSLDVTNIMHASYKNLAIQLVKDMGLRFCGVDLLVDADITALINKKKFKIIEINASPGLTYYSRMGKKQGKIVEDLYLEILKRLEWCFV